MRTLHKIYLIILFLMIVLPCLSQAKYQINNKIYYCYTPNENRVLALLLNDRLEYKELIIQKDARLELYKHIIVTLEDNDKIKDEAIYNLTTKFDKQIELTNQYYDSYVLANKKATRRRDALFISSATSIALLIALILL